MLNLVSPTLLISWIIALGAFFLQLPIYPQLPTFLSAIAVFSIFASFSVVNVMDDEDKNKTIASRIFAVFYYSMPLLAIILFAFYYKQWGGVFSQPISVLEVAIWQILLVLATIVAAVFQHKVFPQTAKIVTFVILNVALLWGYLTAMFIMNGNALLAFVIVSIALLFAELWNQQTEPAPQTQEVTT